MSIGNDTSMRVETLPNLREQVAERMRMAIATGRFPPGARLIERELCEMMGVSRTSLREALRELQAAGLITTQHSRGLSVAVVTREDAEAIYQVRAVLEGLAARLFTRNATTEQMAALRRSVERLAEVYANFSADEFITAKTAFYDILLEGRRQRGRRGDAQTHPYPRVAASRGVAVERGAGAEVDRRAARVHRRHRRAR